MSAISNLIHRCFTDRPLNIISHPTHERYQTNLSRTNHNFYLIQGGQIKKWIDSYAPLPLNHILLDEHKGLSQIPDVDFDCVLIQNRFAAFQMLMPMAKHLNIPCIALEHCTTTNQDPRYLRQHQSMKADINLFISEYSRKAWGWDESNSEVLVHGIDTDYFKPGVEFSERQNVILSVVNDWINRGKILGIDWWKEATQGFPVKVVGDTPGLSKPAADTDELISVYQNSRIFLNTSILSPIPSVLMEAASCGCALVSTKNCMIPDVFTHKKDILFGNTSYELRQHCQTLLKDVDMAKELGENARKTIVERFGLQQFIDRWQQIFQKASNLKL